MEFFYREGRTLEDIGRIFQLSRERVRQILEKRGVKKEDGGRHFKTVVGHAERWLARGRAKDAHARKNYGCAYATVMEINAGRNLSDTSTPAKMYFDQRRQAALRGIAWKMTLPEWWKIWQDSGKWEQRGRGKGAYVMSRRDTAGIYEPANVSISTIEANTSASYAAKPAIRRREACDHKTLTPRQKQIATLFASGLAPNDIAAELGISTQTVQVHLCSIKQKMGLYQRVYADLP